MATDPMSQLDQLGAIVSPDLDAYAAGQIEAGSLTCALCMRAPCRCPRFGSRAYLALCDVRHGKPYTGPAVTCLHCGQEIELVDGGRRWRHLSTETLTGTRHISCGYGGELGTSAEPDGQ